MTHLRRLLAKLIRRHYRGIPDHALHATCNDACPIHGSASEPAEPVVASMPAQRDISVDEETIERAQHEAVVAVARQARELPVPVDVLAETIALEVIWYSPAAGDEG